MNRRIFNSLLISALISIISVNCFGQPIEKPRLMIFSADWCGPCKSMHSYMKNKHVKEVLKKFYITEHDFDIEEDLVKTYGIRSIPTLIVTKNNKEIGRMVGFSSDRLDSFLNKYKGA